MNKLHKLLKMQKTWEALCRASIWFVFYWATDMKVRHGLLFGRWPSRSVETKGSFLSNIYTESFLSDLWHEVWSTSLGHVQVHFPCQAVDDLAKTKAHGAKELYLDSKLFMGVIWVQGKSVQVLCPITPGTPWRGCCPRLLDPLPHYFWIFCTINNSLWLHMKKYNDIFLWKRSSAACLSVCTCISVCGSGSTGHEYHSDQ